MSNKISRTLQRLAAAQRVSMEAADDAVQGATGELSEEELKKVADKAAAEGDSTATDDSTTDDTTTTDDTSTDESNPAVDAAAAFAEDAAGKTDPEAATPDTAADTTQTPDETADAADVPAEEITTPAEGELADLQADEAGQADATADVTDSATAEPTLDATAEPGSDAALTDAAPETMDVDADPAVQQADAVIDADSTDTDPVEAGDAPTPEGSDVVGESAAAETSETSTAEAPKEAVAPGPQTDTSEAVQEVVELSEAVAEAQSAEDVVKKIREIRDDVDELGKTAEVINEDGGVSMESLALLTLGLRAQTNLLGREELGLGVSMESYAGTPRGTRLKITLEEITDLIAELDNAQPNLERQAIESLDRLVCALNDALPTAHDRLRAVISNASASTDDQEGGAVDISDGLGAALSEQGTMPEDLANFLQTYAALGKTLTSNYIETAYRGAKGASMLTNAVDFTSLSAFWEKIHTAVEAIPDPRACLTRTQLEAQLPGSVSLFGQPSPTKESPNVALTALFDYNCNYPPLESALAEKNANDGGTYPALSASKIVLVGKALQETLCCETIGEVLAEGQKLWPEAQDSIRHLRENLRNAPREIDDSAGADFSQIVRFVEVAYSLATWPLLNYLNNLVVSVNAFVLFAERSLTATPQATEPMVDAAAAAAEPVETDVGGEVQVPDDAGLPEPEIEATTVEGDATVPPAAPIREEDTP